jgi:WD40 repeat protein
VATGDLVRTFKEQAENLAFSHDGKFLASVGAAGMVRVWDANSPSKKEFFREPLGPVGFNNKGELIAFGSSLNPVALDPATLNVAKRDWFHLSESRAVAPRLDAIDAKRVRAAVKERTYTPYLGNLSPDGQTVGLFERFEHIMDFRDMRDGKLLCSVEAAKPWVAFAPKRPLVATDTGNATTAVWQLPSGTRLWVFTNCVGIFQALVFSPDENFVVTDEGTSMKLWRIEDNEVKPMRTFNPKRLPVIGLAFSPDGQLFATGEAGGSIKLWAMPSLQEVGVLDGHSRSVMSLAFSPDGRTIASMCDDRTVRLWHVATRREMLRFQTSQPDHYYFSLVFSPDGGALAARRVDNQGAITQIWHAPSLLQIARLQSED